jgi:competence protein ComEC
MTAGVVVTLLTAPLVAWHIGRLSLVAPLTNMAAEPVLDGLQPALFGVLAAAPWDAFARVVAAGATPLLWAFDAIARVGASVPGAAISVAPTPVTALLAGVAVLGFGAACLAVGTNRTRGRPLLVGTAALAAMCWWPGAAGSGWLELHAIDVGQGDAIALRTPHGQWILIDAGPAFGASDAGRSTVVPYLRRRGGSLAAFVLTHPDADHAGGAASVLRAFTPPVVFDPGFVGATGTYRATLEAASAPGTQWRRARAGDSLAVDGVVLTILAPDSAWMSHASSPNDASVVAMVRLGDVRFLLTGDAEAPEEQSLVDALGDRLRADVLKVGHHGSRTSSSAPLLDAVRPRVAVVSVGAHNRYRHPSEAVMTALAERGVEVLRTDRLGSIVVRTDGMHIEVRAGGDAWNVR